MKKDEEIDNMTKEEIQENLTTVEQPNKIVLEETAEELKAMGIPDISKANDKFVIEQALKNIQITTVLEDKILTQNNKKSIEDHLEHHAKFLLSISPGKTMKNIIDKISIEHAKAILKTTAKITDVSDEVISEHLKNLKNKFKDQN